MASKYAEVIKTLMPLPPEDPSYQAEIDAIKAKIRETDVHTSESLVQGYRTARFGAEVPVDDDFIKSMIALLGKEGLTALLKEAQKQVTAYEQLLTESYENDETGWGLYGAGPNTVKMQDGASLAIQMEPVGKVEDKEAFRLWCIANDLENSLQLWPTTMNSLTKDRLLAGEAAPDGVRAYTRPKIVWRKG